MIVLTVVIPKKSLVKVENEQKKIFAFLRKKQIPWIKTNYLDPARAFDIFLPLKAKKYEKIIANYFADKSIDHCWQINRLRRKKILFSDMDGTVIKNETFNDLGKILKLEQSISKITRLGMTGKIDFSESLKKRVALLKGLPAEENLRQLEEKIIFNPGVFRLVRTLKKNQVKTVLITAGFSPISKYVQKEIGFDALRTNHYEMEQGLFTGKTKGKLILPETKAEIMLEVLEKNNLNRSHALALGDAMNDLEMLKKAGLGIAYRGVRGLRREVSKQINFSDLVTALYYQGYSKEEIFY